MLDKSVPYVGVYMHRRKSAAIPDYKLPEGYRYTLFQPGDEVSWAEIETSVLEFCNHTEALTYFQNNYLPYLSALNERCFFIENEHGDKVATGTVWWCCPDKCDPWLHWVAVKPQYQGLGLGKAMASKITQMAVELEGDRDIYLHTQTWSYKAIGIYKKCGYVISDEKKICNYTNDHYEQAIEVLHNISK